jgi:ubiquinone/menaquinone biosynthesis C-methylase UbiE
MTPQVARNDIERWILSELAPSRSTTAELAYERMESQSDECLAVIYQPLDYRNRGHWHDTAVCSAFAHAVRGAGTVLDVGPGDGWPSLRIADRFEKVIGIDPSPRRVRVQRENAARLGIPNVEYLEMDALAMTFDDGSFGGVTAASSIEQTGDPRMALAEVLRVLKPGGSLAMDFENFERYFPDGDGDEELWSDTKKGEPVVFYQVRTKFPPRETRYAFFFDPLRIRDDAQLARILGSLEEDSQRLENLGHGDSAPQRPPELDLAFFQSLEPFVRETKYFELEHLTTPGLDALLRETGFVDVRHTDVRFPDVRGFFDAVAEEGSLEEFADTFVEVSERFGIEAVENAGPPTKPGGFAVAIKPPRAAGE